MNAKSLRNRLNQQAVDLAAAVKLHTRVRRLAKPIIKRLRNCPITHVSISANTWDDAEGNVYIFMSKKIFQMSETEGILEKMENLPIDKFSSYEESTKGWATEDDQYDGTRKFQRIFFHNDVRYFIQLTAIPEEKSDAAGHVPKCRRVVIGEKQETRTVPLYEIICDKE